MKALVAMIAAAVLVTATAPAYAKFCEKNGKTYICRGEHEAKDKSPRDCKPKE